MKPRSGESRQFLVLGLFALIVICLAWRRLLIQGEVPVDGQVIGLTFPNWSVSHSLWEHSAIPLWNPARNLGEPYAADPRTMALYPPMWLFSRADFAGFMRLWAVFHTLLAGAFMALLAQRWYRSRPASVAAGVVAGLNGFFTAHLTCPNHFASAAWLPAVLYFQDSGSIAGLGVCLALQWLSGFPSFFILSLLSVIGLACHRGRGALGCLLKGGILGAGLSAAGWMPFLELLTHSVRGVVLTPDMAVQFSVPWKQLFKEIFVPQWFFFRPEVAGDPAIVVFYVGLIVIAAAIWGIGAGRREKRIAAAVVGAFILSIGGGLPGYRLMPFLHVFRFPANWLLISTTGLTLLAAAGIARVRGRGRQWLVVFSIAADLVLFCQFRRVGWALPEFFNDAPALAKVVAGADSGGPVRVYHTERLMNAWRRGFLSSESDYFLMRQLFAPSFGTAFGIHEVRGERTLLSKEASAFQERLAQIPPLTGLLRMAGVSLVLDLDGDSTLEPKNVRLTWDRAAKKRVFLYGAEGTDKIDILDYRPGRVHAVSSTARAASVVFTETDYPGWGTFLDGKRVEHGRFEGVFPTFRVPAGRHDLLFVFRSRIFEAGAACSLLTAVILMVVHTESSAPA